MSPSMSFNLGTDNMWKPDEWSYLGLVAKERMEHRYEGSPEERLINNRVFKWCEIEQGASEEISEVGQNGKTEEIVW